MTIAEQLQFVIQGGQVKRFHIVPLVHSNTVGHHSFGVAWLCYLLSEQMPRPELLLAALAHDMGEQEVGDVPSTTKRGLGISEKLETMEREARCRNGFHFLLTEEEQRTLDLADKFDGMLFCVQERSLGNVNMEAPFYRWATWINKEVKFTELQRRVFEAVLELWEAALSNRKDWETWHKT